MFLPRCATRASKPSPIVCSKSGKRVVIATIGMILMQALAGTLWAQEKEKIFGQRLVDSVVAKHRREVIYLGLHAQTPQSEKSVIFASTDSGKIGKESSCADLHVVDKGIPVLEMKGNSTTVLERLLDSSGHTVGLIVVGFSFTDGQESQAAKLGKEIGEELAQQIPSKSRLFDTGK
jgi:hypothetical protein